MSRSFRIAWGASKLFALTIACAGPARAEDDHAPLRLGASYVTDIIANVDGGERRGANWLGRADATVEFEGRLFGIDRTHAFLDVMYTHGPEFSGAKVGDAQVVSNIEADPALRAIEAWISIPLLARDTTAKAGLIDLNTEFDVQEVGSFFLNSSHGVGPEFSQSGLNGPSIFPVTATGLVLRSRRTGWSARLGVFDAVAGSKDNPRKPVLRLPGHKGALIAAEVDLDLGPTALLRFGIWGYTSKFDAISGTGEHTRRPRAGRGAYAMVEGRLAGQDNARTLNGWIRMGLADHRVHAIGSYLGGGLTYGDDHRKLGLAVAIARLGEPARAAGTVGTIRPDWAEANIEFSYSHALNDWLTIQPDVQYVLNPGWNPARRHALVAGVRMMVSLLAP